MPDPSVEPMPRPPIEWREVVPLDAHDASYFAASARIASFWVSSMVDEGLYEYTVQRQLEQVKGLCGISGKACAHRLHTDPFGHVHCCLTGHLSSRRFSDGRSHRFSARHLASPARRPRSEAA